MATDKEWEGLKSYGLAGILIGFFLACLIFISL